MKTIAITEVRTQFEDHLYRSPLKFGGVITDQVTLLNVWVRVKDTAGKEAEGFGSMPLGNVWSFPSKKHTYHETLEAMKRLAGAIAQITQDYPETGHPIDLFTALEPAYLQAASAVQAALGLQEAIPKLCTLVVASPFDAALHDAYGKLHGVSSYHTYSKDYMTHDLAHYLDARFQGEFLQAYVSPEPKPSLPLYHLIGAVDPLTTADIPQRKQDGLAETLAEWIHQDGLTHLKIKLNGNNLEWDVQRVTAVDRICEETQAARGLKHWHYSLDFNEQCQTVDYLLAFLAQVQEQAPHALSRVQYIEQPTARDLQAHPDNKMHKAAAIKPVVIDESLVDYESLMLARELGYTGVALKACKGQSQALLMGAAAQKHRMFLCVQDLTCPGASFLHSAGLAAHVPPVAAIEGNGRQYCPSANEGWRDRFPGIFTVRNGQIATACLNGPGLGIV
ncbi:MAG: enolase C-terminal domain-like protein [bacterium]|jgi:L-alanine-DL-glutamate epimerase-like enolase superfamily enzyme|nr:enolase C-terminal domain-like protein [bacterium]